MYDIRRLRMLLEISERGTITAAAKTLHLTSSAISQQISVLEKEVGAPLLTKVGRGVQLTTAGQIVVDGARAILHEIDVTATKVAHLSGEPSGTVRISVFQSATIALLVPLLGYLEENYPQVRLEVEHIDPETGLELTRSRQFDVVISESYPHHTPTIHNDLHQEHLTYDPLHLVVPAASDIYSLEQAADFPWVLEGAHNTSHQFAVNQCRINGFEPDVRYKLEDLISQVNLVKSGRAVAILPALLTSSLSSSEGIRLIEIEGSPEREILLSCRADSVRLPPVEAVITALQHLARHFHPIS